MQPEKLGLMVLILLYVSIVAWLLSVSIAVGGAIAILGAAIIRGFVEDAPELVHDIGMLLQESRTSVFVIGSVIATFFVLYFSNITNAAS